MEDFEVENRINELPEEVLIKIFEFLPEDDLREALDVCFK
jgi:F-box-like